MALTLEEVSPAGARVVAGSDEFEVAEGGHVIIETSPGGAEILDYVAPAGGAIVNISLTITEAP